MSSPDPRLDKPNVYEPNSVKESNPTETTIPSKKRFVDSRLSNAIYQLFSEILPWARKNSNRWLIRIAVFFLLLSWPLSRFKPEVNTSVDADQAWPTQLWLREFRLLAPTISLGIAGSLLAGAISDLAALTRQNQDARVAITTLLGIKPEDKVAFVMTRFKFNENTDVRKAFREGIFVSNKIYGGRSDDEHVPDALMLSDNDFNGALLLLNLFKSLELDCTILFDDAVFAAYETEFQKYLCKKTNKVEQNFSEKLEYRSKLSINEEELSKYGIIISVGWHSNELTGWVLHHARSDKNTEREFPYLQEVAKKAYLKEIGKADETESDFLEKKQSVLSRVRIPQRVCSSKPNILIIGGKEAEDTYGICDYVKREYSTLLEEEDLKTSCTVAEATDFQIQFSQDGQTLKVDKRRCLPKPRRNNL